MGTQNFGPPNRKSSNFAATVAIAAAVPLSGRPKAAETAEAPAKAAAVAAKIVLKVQVGKIRNHTNSEASRIVHKIMAQIIFIMMLVLQIRTRILSIQTRR